VLWSTGMCGNGQTQLQSTYAIGPTRRMADSAALLVCDAGNSYLTAEGVGADPESPMSHLLGS